MRVGVVRVITLLALLIALACLGQGVAAQETPEVLPRPVGSPQQAESQRTNSSEDDIWRGTTYTLVVRNSTPSISPGDPLQLEVYLVGWGVPQKNKLHVSWPSAHVIDMDNPGRMVFGSVDFTAKGTDERGFIVGNGIHRVAAHTIPGGRDTIGVGHILDPEVFMFVPGGDEPSVVPEFGVPSVFSERNYGGVPPVALTLNTRDDAQPGDYEIVVVFTYADDQGWQQSYNAAKFHVRGWWERNQGWIAIVGVAVGAMGVLVALGSLLLSSYERVTRLRSRN